MSIQDLIIYNDKDQFSLHRDFELELKLIIPKSTKFDLNLNYDGIASVEVTFKTNDTSWRDYIKIEENELYKPFILNVIKFEDVFIKFRFTNIKQEIILKNIVINNVEYLQEGRYGTSFVTVHGCDGCKTITKGCSQFRPYEGLEIISQRQSCVNDAINNTWGFPVLYFKVDPVKNTEIYTLKNWQEYVTKEPKQLNVILPRNELPEDMYIYDEKDTVLNNSFELHIAIGNFKRAFGAMAQPSKNDFFYFPLLKRILEVNQMKTIKGFQYSDNFWAVSVYDFRVKNAIKDDYESLIDNIVDIYEYSVADLENDFYDNSEELNEQDKVLLSDQDNTSIDFNLLKGLGKTDSYRQKISKNAYIKPYNLLNYDVQISNHVYTSNRRTLLKEDNVALVEYKNPYSLFEGKELSILMWTYFGGKNRISSNVASFNNCTIRLDENLLLSFKNGDNSIILDNPIELNKWYAIGANISYVTKKMRITIYSIAHNVNTPKINRTSQLIIEETKVSELVDDTPFENDTKSFLFENNNTMLTNIKVYAQTFELEAEAIEIQRTRTINRSLIVYDAPYPVYNLTGRITR